MANLDKRVIIRSAIGLRDMKNSVRCCFVFLMSWVFGVVKFWSCLYYESLIFLQMFEILGWAPYTIANSMLVKASSLEVSKLS